MSFMSVYVLSANETTELKESHKRNATWKFYDQLPTYLTLSYC